jgi:uncharacterized protein (DUF2267 family)
LCETADITEIQAFDRALETAEQWISDLMQHLGWHDRGRTYLALVAVLYALYHCLPADEVVYLGNQSADLAAWPLLLEPTRHAAQEP